MVQLIKVLCLLVLFSGVSFASVLGVDPYRDAQLIKSHSQIGQMIDIPLGKIRKVGRGWEPESIVRINGDYFTSLYKIDRNAVLSSVYDHYRAQMLKNGQTILFECESRSCGSSNAWANNFFEDYLLYGADQNQYLLVVKSELDVYQTLYLNRRGAGDVVVRLDEVKLVEGRNTELEIVAQMDVQDVPRIRRFLRDLPLGQNVVGFVTSERSGSLNAIEFGDQLISSLSAGLGEQLNAKARFINLADLGRESLGVNRISFVYVRP